MSVRFNTWTDRIETFDDLPPATGWTVFGWAKVINFRPGSYRPLTTLEEGFFTHRQRLFWFSDDNFYIDGDFGGASPGNPSTSGWFAWAMSCAGTAANDLVGRLRNNADSSWSSASATGVNLSPRRLTVGNYDDFNWIDAEMSHVRMWDAVLSLAELNVEFASPTVVRTTNLRRVLRLADASTAGLDSSGNGFHMSVTGLVDGAGEPTFPQLTRFRKSFSVIGGRIGARQLQ